MNDVGAAVLLSQSIVDRADIEEQKLACGACVGSLEERIRRQVDDHQRDAALYQCTRGSHRIGASHESHVLERELLIEECPRRVVVVDGEPRTRHSIIGGWHLDQ